MDPAASPTAGRFAFPALIAGNLILALGPWMVRLADVGPVASGFWRVGLAMPFLALFAWQLGTFFRRNRPGTYGPDALPPEVLPRQE